RPHLDLHSFPTRRSSDLDGAVWRVRFGPESELQSLKDFAGLRDIHTLLTFRGRPLSALEIIRRRAPGVTNNRSATPPAPDTESADRKSTRLNSSHDQISY